MKSLSFETNIPLRKKEIPEEIKLKMSQSTVITTGETAIEKVRRENLSFSSFQNQPSYPPEVLQLAQYEAGMLTAITKPLDTSKS